MGTRWVGVGALLCGAWAGTGCFSPPPEAQTRLEAVKAQGEAFEADLDTIEERILGGQALVHQWQELGRRHRQVTQVTCENLAKHVAGMEHHFELQDEKAARIRRRRLTASVASPSKVSAAPAKGRKHRRAD